MLDKKFDKEKEKELFIDYLKNNNYTFYKHEWGITTYYFWIHKDYDYEDYSKEIFKTVDENDKNSLNEMKAKILGNDKFSSMNIKRTYLLGKWDTNCIKDKEFLKNIEYFLGSGDGNSMLDFIESTPMSSDSKLSMIKELPVSVLSAYHLSFENLTKFVNNSRLNDNKKQIFYIDFFKSRKNQIVGKTGLDAENFLISLYGVDKDKLEPYFSFFPNINNRFNEIELDIQEPGYIVFSVRLNTRLAGKLLGNMPETVVQGWIDTFSGSMGKTYKVQKQMEVYSKSKAIYEVRFYKTSLETKIDSNFNVQNYNRDLKSFLIHMSQLTEKPKLSFEYIEKWLLQHDLTKKLDSLVTEDKSIEKTKKTKI